MNASNLSIGTLVILPAGYSVGMGTLKQATPAHVHSIEHDEHGRPFYRLIWRDKRGRERTTYWTAA